jgi:hypothetical protein
MIFLMEAMMTKGMVAVVVPIGDPLPLSWDTLTLLLKQQPLKRPDIGVEDPNGLEQTIYHFTIRRSLIRHSLPRPLLLLALTLSSFPVPDLSFDLPKTILNRAIGSTQFRQGILGLNLNGLIIHCYCEAFLGLVSSMEFAGAVSSDASPEFRSRSRSEQWQT